MIICINHPTTLSAIVKKASEELNINEAILMRTTHVEITYTSMGAIIKITPSYFRSGKGWRKLMSTLLVLNNQFKNGMYGPDAQFAHRAPYVQL